MTVTQPVVPTWAAPAPQAVKDMLTVTAPARADYARGVFEAVDWATQYPISYDDAGQRMTEALAVKGDRHQDGVADGLAWLMGIAPPPVELPRRNPDGTLVTADQLYRELAEGNDHWIAEQRQAARDEAERKAARWRYLASL